LLPMPFLTDSGNRGRIRKSANRFYGAITMKPCASMMLTLTLSLALGACSTPSPESLAQHDPWEKTNRDIFDFDVRLDNAVARPIAKGYRAVVPEPVRGAIHNALNNLNAPVVLANDVLQGEGGNAVNTAGRIVINSTVGLGGQIDVASKIGIPGHDNDFGITLGKNGVAEGSYLVLPFAGPLPPAICWASQWTGPSIPSPISASMARTPG
jgi:phospholipid-binding lipoprotein MlaA